MSSPILWIIFPVFCGVALFYLRRFYRLTVSLGIGISLLLSVLAWRLPISESIQLGPWLIKIGETFSLLGRQLNLTNADRPQLLFIYLVAAVWFGAALLGQAGRAFVPLGLLSCGLVTAVTAVDPFLYAGLLLEILTLVCVVIFTQPGRPVSRGVIRFLLFQTLGMPFILFTGWLLTGVESNPGEITLVSRAAIFLGFGFALWLAIFPFHTWLPMIAETAHPLVSGFVFMMFPFVVMFFGLSFLDRYAWLRSTPQLYDLLRLMGVLMVLTGGIMAAFQRDLGRMLGFAVMVEIGKSILTVSFSDGIPFFFIQLLPRAITLVCWGLGLSLIQMKSKDLHFDNVKGFARKLPFASASVILAQFSVAGLPLLAGFPILLSLSRQLAIISPVVAELTLLGSIGLFVGGLRSMGHLIISDENSRWQIQENTMSSIFLSIAMLALFLIGIFPQVFLPALANLSLVFERLIPLP